MELLKNRLVGLVAAIKTRGARIIITSNHTPSSALLVEIGATAQGAQEAPISPLPKCASLSSNRARRSQD